MAVYKRFAVYQTLKDVFIAGFDGSTLLEAVLLPTVHDEVTVWRGRNISIDLVTLAGYFLSFDPTVVWLFIFSEKANIIRLRCHLVKLAGGAVVHQSHEIRQLDLTFAYEDFDRTFLRYLNEVLILFMESGYLSRGEISGEH